MSHTLPNMHCLLLTIEYGSRLYGTNTEHSDTDYYHVYLPTMNDMIAGTVRDLIHVSTKQDQNAKNTSADIDNNYVTIQRLLTDYIRGEAYAVEIIQTLLNDPLSANIAHIDPIMMDLVIQFHSDIMIGAESDGWVPRAMFSMLNEFARRVKLNASKVEFSDLATKLSNIDSLSKDYREWASHPDFVALLNQYAPDNWSIDGFHITIMGRQFPTNLRYVKLCKRLRETSLSQHGFTGVEHKEAAHIMRLHMYWMSWVSYKRIHVKLPPVYADQVKRVKQSLTLPNEMLDDVATFVPAHQSVFDNCQFIADKFHPWLTSHMVPLYGISM